MRRVSLLGRRAQRKAQEIDLRLRGGEQEIALVARHVGGREEIAMARTRPRAAGSRYNAR